MEQCAVCQDVPEYDWWISQGDPDKSLEVILARNPLPGVTGYVCNHLCQIALHAQRLRGNGRHPGAQALRGGARQGAAAEPQSRDRQAASP